MRLCKALLQHFNQGPRPTFLYLDTKSCSFLNSTSKMRMSFIKDMHVKKKPVTITYDPEEVQIEMDEYQRVHQQFVKNRPFPIKGDDRSIGFYPNIPNSPLSFRPKYPDVPYDDLQDRTYKGEPIHEHWEVVNTFAPDIDPRYTTSGMLAITGLFFGAVTGTCFLVYYFDEPYKRALAIPRTLYIDDPYLKQFEDRVVPSVRAWPNYKDFIEASKYSTSKTPVPSYFERKNATAM